MSTTAMKSIALRISTASSTDLYEKALKVVSIEMLIDILGLLGMRRIEVALNALSQTELQM